MSLLRLIVLQTILAAALAALWLAGPLAQVLSSDSRWFVLAVLAIGGAGLFLTATGRIEGAARLQDMLPVIAVVAMQIGILSALAIMAQALTGGGDPAKAVGGFMAAASTAIYVSVVALCSYLWSSSFWWLCFSSPPRSRKPQKRQTEAPVTYRCMSSGPMETPTLTLTCGTPKGSMYISVTEPGKSGTCCETILVTLPIWETETSRTPMRAVSRPGNMPSMSTSTAIMQNSRFKLMPSCVSSQI